jgi:hypothetical protein
MALTVRDTKAMWAMRKLKNVLRAERPSPIAARLICMPEPCFFASAMETLICRWSSAMTFDGVAG